MAGFNIEYSGVLFMLFFLSEYLNILFMSSLISVLFLGGYSELSLVKNVILIDSNELQVTTFVIKTLLVSFSFI